MKVETPAICVSVYRDLFDLSHFIATVEAETRNEWSDISWRNSSVGNGIVGQHRTSVECELSHLGEPHIQTPLAEMFKHDVKTPLMKAVEDYITEYSIGISGHEGWRLLKYSKGAEYHAHYDHSSSNCRTMSLVAFGGEQAEGGELEFPYLGITIKPEPNTAIVFPANYPYIHIAHPITGGTKYSLVTWFK